MFGVCPCVNARDGVFVLAIGICLAVWSPVFLDADFAALLAAFLRTPLHPPMAFAIWLMGMISGLILLIAGIRENLRDGDGAPVLSSLAIIIATAVAIHHQWYLPRAIGTRMPYLTEALYIALMAACCANLCMAYAARVRRSRLAKEIEDQRPAPDPRDAALDEYRDALAAYAQRDAEQIRWIADLSAQLAARRPDETNYRQLVAENREMKALLTFPGARAALLHTLHSDHHAGATAREQRVRDEAVTRLTAIYKRIGEDR
jgi:hypothetical protein